MKRLTQFADAGADCLYAPGVSELEQISAIVQAVVNIAASRNMTTAAEGVETEQQRKLWRELGCTQMQGFLFSAPKPASEIRRLLDMDQATARVSA